MTGVSMPPELADRLRRAVLTEQSRHRIPSISAAIGRGGDVLWADAVGLSDGREVAASTETQYRIGSISKTITTIAVLRLAADGLLELSTPVGAILGAPFDAPPLARVSVEDLLSHRSGLRAETEPPWWERSAGRPWEALAAELTAPGESIRQPTVGVFHYSNVGFGVLGEIVSRLRERPWHEVVAQEVLAPLGMTRTTLRPVAPAARGLAVHPYADVVVAEPEHDAGAMAPAGQWWSTTGDLVRLAWFLHAGDPAVLGAAWLGAMKRPLTWADLPGQAWTSAYGLGLEVINQGGARSYGHGGSMPGFQASLRFAADTGDSVVVLTNTTAGASATLPDALAAELAQTVEPEPWRADPAHAEVLDLVGAWFWGPAPFALRAADDGGLTLTPLERGRGSRFVPAGPDTWLGLDGYFTGERLSVVRADDGTPLRLDLASFVFTRTPYPGEPWH